MQIKTLLNYLSPNWNSYHEAKQQQTLHPVVWGRGTGSVKFSPGGSHTAKSRTAVRPSCAPSQCIAKGSALSPATETAAHHKLRQGAPEMPINRYMEKENEVQRHMEFYSTINRSEIITFAGKLVQRGLRYKTG